MEQSGSKSEEEEKRDRKIFDLYLETEVPPSVRRKYSNLLLAEQNQFAKENRAFVDIPIEERKKLLNKAFSDVNYGHVDPEKMERDYNKSSRRGPPIGGSKDD